ncbi:MAG: hypothetical protein ABIM74_08765 [candidate division WOR-3 bacterium]
MILAMVFLFSSSDPIFGPDKARHAASSFILFTSAYTLLDSRCEWQATASAAGITVSAGLLKEFYDYKRKAQFSWQDLIWDGVGLLAGAAVVVVGRK